MSTILLSYWRHNLVNSVCLNVRGFLSVCQSHAVLPWSLQAIVFSSIFVSWRIFLINPHTFGQALVTWRTENNIALEMQKKRKKSRFSANNNISHQVFRKAIFPELAEQYAVRPTAAATVQHGRFVDVPDFRRNLRRDLAQF